MPISPEFSYQETETLITVTVKLLGASPKNCDVFVSDVLLKINRSPHLLVLDLHAAVDDTTSTVSFTPEGLTVNLRKARAAMWGVLKADAALLGGKEGVAKRREASVERQQAAANAVRQQRLTAASVNKRMATHAGIDLDRAQRQLIDDRKASEKAQAEAEMYAALEEAEQTRTEPTTEEPSWEEVEGEDAQEGEDGIWEEVDAAEAAEAVPEQREPEPEPQVAPVRSYASGHVAPVTYTKSKQPDHLQHLPARTKPEDMPSAETAIKPIDDDAVDLGEQNALFLKDRGDGFFGRRDYEAAVNAYSAALTLDRELPAVFSNRAACYFCLSDYAACAKDCSSALRLLRSKLEELKKDRTEAGAANDEALMKELATVNRSLLRALARRASARTLMGEHDEAVEDYEEAVRLDPKNDDLKADLEAAVEAAVEAKTTGVTNLKAEADGHFGKGQYSKAKDCYTKALRLAGGAHLGCLSNRAACHLMLGEDMQCVKDCTAAMEQLPGAALLSAEDGVEEVEEGEQAEEERKKTERTRLRLHVRRGTASARLGDVAGARADYVVAKELSTDAAELAQLERDLGKRLDPTGLDLD
jgi:dyslexia susceptibility 1 candidate gene 1 protein